MRPSPTAVQHLPGLGRLPVCLLRTSHPGALGAGVVAGQFPPCRHPLQEAKSAHHQPTPRVSFFRHEWKQKYLSFPLPHPLPAFLSTPIPPTVLSLVTSQALKAI